MSQREEDRGAFDVDEEADRAPPLAEAETYDPASEIHQEEVALAVPATLLPPMSRLRGAAATATPAKHGAAPISQDYILATASDDERERGRLDLDERNANGVGDDEDDDEEEANESNFLASLLNRTPYVEDEEEAQPMVEGDEMPGLDDEADDAGKGKEMAAGEEIQSDVSEYDQDEAVLTDPGSDVIAVEGDADDVVEVGVEVLDVDAVAAAEDEFADDAGSGGIIFARSRVKRLMKYTTTSRLISKEAVDRTAQLSELLVQELVECAKEVAKRRGKKTISYEHIAEVVRNSDRFSFLMPILPAPKNSAPLFKKSSKA